MDNKQLKKLLGSVYKSLVLTAIFCCGWVLYKSIMDILNQPLLLWLSITLIALSALTIVLIFINIGLLKKLKNFYKYAVFIRLYFTIIFLGIIAGIVALDYLQYDISFNYIYIILVLILSEVFVYLILKTSLALQKAYKNSSIVFDVQEKTPDYNDEIALKKRLDELNRKLDMKDIVKQIEEAEKKLAE